MHILASYKKRACRVKEQDFIETIEANNRIIHNICRLYFEDKDDRMDLYQEIVTQLWKTRYTFRGESKISTWIYRVALNLAISEPCCRFLVYEHSEFITGNL